MVRDAGSVGTYVVAVAAAALASLARAAQPGAASPIAAPMRPLQWGKLNFLHTTDTHGWHGGHLQESQYSADWGDYVSFADHLRRTADERGVDLLLVDTGDRVEGNGLYDASSPKGQYYYDIYREQSVDIICTGNHELYHASTADEEHRQTVPNFKNNYVASNLDYIDPRTDQRTPMAQRYRKFQTKNQKLDIVAFGFLFDFTGNANNTVVQPVRETIKEQWFQDAIREKADAFVVIGHVGVQMQEFKDIFAAIRKQNWFTPILFFGGHVHVRDATAYDSRSFAIASGRYFETIGWMSIDGNLKKTGTPPRTIDPPLSFNRRYIDNNLLGLYHHTGLNETTFPTDHGRNVSAAISRARKELNLDYSFGCAPRDYWMTRTPYPHRNSIYSWLEKEVLPDIAVLPSRKDVPRLVIMNTGAIRFDIFKGAFTRDTTYIISPFLSVLNYIPDVPYSVASKVLGLLNNAGQILEAAGAVDARYMAIPEQLAIHESIIYNDKSSSSSAAFDDSGNAQQKPLGDSGSDSDGDGSDSQPSLVGGYTTKDDIGDDGDDAVHSNINFYVVPNCIQTEIGIPSDDDGKQAKPETVDLVFFDFIQPWVLMALKFSGGDCYSAQDVLPYVDGTFTELMAAWIKKNWPVKCGD
ncbi:Metallo-dependent phosphatase-like protein [Podospora appendiculata]|uniref:Metallo-dependent phosphatase-like protein n=1 Tax=Podospora appendiculata TaxID=314037 RepID=A0AAE0XIS2_9PEZI|nr:Metallo-dependent phosphatase-like protein [Podospora appendiculata]